MCTVAVQVPGEASEKKDPVEKNKQRDQPSDLDESLEDIRERSLRRYQERTRYVDRVPISRASGNPRDHETLYQLRDDTWILHRQYLIDGFYPRLVEIDKARAAAWLSQNGYELPEELEFPSGGSP